jgi:hypothetical protein
MEGPQDVPGLSMYTYTASGGLEAQRGWQTPEGGTPLTTGGDSQMVTWDAGPDVGDVVYKASNDYSWSREVFYCVRWGGDADRRVQRLSADQLRSDAES